MIPWTLQLESLRCRPYRRTLPTWRRFISWSCATHTPPLPLPFSTIFIPCGQATRTHSSNQKSSWSSKQAKLTSEVDDDGSQLLNSLESSNRCYAVISMGNRAAAAEMNVRKKQQMRRTKRQVQMEILVNMCEHDMDRNRVGNVRWSVMVGKQNSWISIY